jgi:hypothetical protein
MPWFTAQRAVVFFVFFCCAFISLAISPVGKALSFGITESSWLNSTAAPSVISTTEGDGTCDPNAYNITNGAGAIVPGVTDIGNHCDDCNTAVTLPFPVTLYGNTYTAAQAGSNGYLSFGGFSNSFYSGCLPNSTFTYTIFPFEVDQNTVPAGRGIFTTTTGSAPNRTFYIEWRNCLYSTSTTCISGSDNNYEIALHEGSSSFDIIYGTFQSVNSTLGAIGVQQNTTVYNQSQCNAGPPSSSQQTYSGVCATPTPTATNTPTNTPTATATATATGTATGTPLPVVTLWYNGDFDGQNGLA